MTTNSKYRTRSVHVGLGNEVHMNTVESHPHLTTHVHNSVNVKNEGGNLTVNTKEIELEDVEDVVENAVEVEDDVIHPSNFISKVRRSTTVPNLPAPSVTERYIHDSRHNIVTREDLENHIEWHMLRAKILTELISRNQSDLKLAANILDRTERVIVSANNLKLLIACALSVDANEIILEYQHMFEDCCGCCAKGMSYVPIKEVTKLNYDGQSLLVTQDELMNAIHDIYHISIHSVYLE